LCGDLCSRQVIQPESRFFNRAPAVVDGAAVETDTAHLCREERLLLVQPREYLFAFSVLAESCSQRFVDSLWHPRRKRLLKCGLLLQQSVAGALRLCATSILRHPS
jgi:hypothetical protein